MADVLNSYHDLACGICSKILRDPHILPCDHTFCKHPCLIPYDTEPPFVFCPICYIEVPTTEIFPDKEKASLLQVSLKAHSNAPLFSCASCLQSCPKLQFCFHCNQSICQTCFDSHVTVLIRLLVEKKKYLLQSRQKLTCFLSPVSVKKGESAISEHTELLAEVEQVTAILQDSCYVALEKAKNDLETAELRKNESLFNAFDSLKDLGQIFCSMLGQQFKDVEDISRLIIFKNQAESIIKSVEEIYNALPATNAHTLTDFGVSKSFETIHMHLKSMNLIVFDSLRNYAHFESDEIHRRFVYSSSSNSLEFESTRHDSSGDNLFRSGYSSYPKELGDRTIFVGGVCYLLREEELSEYFSQFGNVIKAFIPYSPKNKSKLGFGFVTFVDKCAAQLALEEKTHNIGHFHVDVRPFRADRFSMSKHTGHDESFSNFITDASIQSIVK